MYKTRFLSQADSLAEVCRLLDLAGDKCGKFCIGDKVWANGDTSPRISRPWYIANAYGGDNRVYSLVRHPPGTDLMELMYCVPENQICLL